MAYPAPLVAPFVYRANYHASEKRSHGNPPGVRFGASSDANATTNAALLAGYTLAQQTSLTKRLGAHNFRTTHPTGTRLSVRVLQLDADPAHPERTAAWRLNLRNLKATTTQDDLGTIFSGVVVGTSALAALSAPCELPNSHQVVTIVNASIVIKT